MTEMVTQFDWLESGLLSGTTILLLVGSLALLIFRQPVARQRIAELSIALTLIWLFLAILPLPRLSSRAATVASNGIHTREPLVRCFGRPNHARPFRERRPRTTVAIGDHYFEVAAEVGRTT